ncbi:MAG TPA: lysine--tRNA ligase [Geminicoccaceae bacterium]|nr:lysine--tRNA ligase [Geminicoccaceae bacterium]
MAEDRELLRASKAWPVVEAVRLLERVENSPPEKGFVLFQTGYGPSGLPHIGTFAEVFRTSLIRQAFEHLSDLPTRLFAFSDDMDGLRAIPDNIPNSEMVARHLQRPLTSIPDPFGTAESYGHNMNQRLRSFLDGFGFEYEFVSATDCYRAGRFDEVLRRVLERHEAIRQAVLPTLGAERQETYSPILPICPESGRVLQVAILDTDPAAGTVTYRNEAGRVVEQSILGGQGKLQWRADWAMRWTALGVDYEMSGKDLIDSVKVSSRICRILGGVPPEGFSYELFLDEHGHKISKSKGNGLTVDEWLRYGTRESLKLYMFQAPRKAKRLYFDVIPRHVDDYYGLLERYQAQDQEQRLHNPVWHIHDGRPPQYHLPISFAMLLNLASVVNAEAPAVLWSFVNRYAPDATPENAPMLDELIERALAYYRDFVKPSKSYRPPSENERVALAELADWLDAFEPHGVPGEDRLAVVAEAIQQEVYEIGKRHGFADDLRGWFKALYEILLGQSEGPRFGSFVAFYGAAETTALIRRALQGPPLDQSAA